MLVSEVTDLGPVTLPPWRGRRKYMHTIPAGRPGVTSRMADGYEDYGPVVDELAASAGVGGGEVHMTVDEMVVPAGMSQRRPGAHVDGCYMPAGRYWGHGGGSGGGTGGAWAHYCNNVPLEEPVPRMAVIVAASVPGCTVYEGRFEGTPKRDGDLEHIRGQLGEGRLLEANRGYLLSPDCVHESLRFEEPTQRTFLRIAYAV